MPDFNHQHDEARILNLANEPVVSYSVSPQFSESLALKSLPDSARIIHVGQSPEYEV